MKVRRAGAIVLAVAAVAALAIGILLLLRRFGDGCDAPCATVTTYEGGVLVLGGLFLAAAAVLAWGESRSGDLDGDGGGRGE